VFTGGQHWIATSEDVEIILKDNSYRKVGKPKTGDLVVYRNEDGVIQHTGVVRVASPNGMVLVESRWGEMSRFIHPPDVHPFTGTTTQYYRSARPGHVLFGLPGGPEPQSFMSLEPAD
jgi:hypothetical protein